LLSYLTINVSLVKMKTKKSHFSTVLGMLALGLAISAAPMAHADQDSQVAAFKKMLSNVPPLELAAQAAKLVTQAQPTEQKSVVIAVVRAAVESTPSSAPFVVSAVARAVPALAPVAAATAAALEPKQAGPIAKAACAAAPSQAAKIVFAMCKALPGSYRIIAIGASEATPAANQEILLAVSRALPDLKRVETLALASGSLQLAGTAPASAPVDIQLPQGPPPFRPPFTPGSSNGQNHRAQDVVVQPGEGRIYSGP
jgi:hypothetical protein